MAVPNNLETIIHSASLYRLHQNTVICLPEYTVICLLENHARAAVSLQDIHVKLSPCDLILLPPQTTLEICPDHFTIFLFVRIYPEFLLQTIDAYDSFRQCLCSAEISRINAITADVLKLSHLYLTEKESSRYRIISRMYDILAILEPLLSPDPGRLDTSSSAARRGLKLTQYISRHIQEPLKLQDTAAALGLTPQYLASCFQKHFGCTFLTYVNQEKIRRCQAWIEFTQLPEEAVASAFGFADGAAFQKQFVRILGQTPDAFREQAWQGLTYREPPGDSVLPVSSHYTDLLLSDHTTKQSSPFYAPETANSNPSSDQAGHQICRLRPDCKKPMYDSWRDILNLGYAHYYSNPSIRSQLKDIQDEIPFRYGRISRLLDFTTIHPLKDSSFYGFEIIFRTLDFMQSLHLIPFLDLGFKNIKFPVYYIDTPIIYDDDPIDVYYTKLIQILPDFIRACCNRYGKEIVEQWRFEVYYDFINETEMKSNITFWQFLNYYKEIQRILKTYLPACQAGGFGYNTFLPLEAFEKRLELLKAQEVEPDFFSFYVFGIIEDGDKIGLSADPEYVLEKTKRAVYTIRSHYPAKPIYITEFNLNASSQNYLNDTVFQSCYLARYLNRNLSLVQGMGYFTLSDITVIPSAPEDLLFGGNGLYTCPGIRKPVFYTYYFFNRLGNKILHQDKYSLITAHSRYSLQALFYHYVHTSGTADFSLSCRELLSSPEHMFEPAPPRHIQIQIPGLTPGVYLFKTYLLSPHQRNLFQYWAKYRSINNLSEQDLEFFARLSYPETDLFIRTTEDDGLLTFTVTLNPSEVKLFLIDYVSQS